jgi:MoaA/NifB/PqqE/SkfB family radical SAM enzyme
MKVVYKLIQLNRTIQNHRIKFGAVALANLFSFRHLFLRFDPVMACNLSCTMCYFSNDDYRKNTKGIFKEEEIERIAGMLFPLSVQVVFGCGTEPTLYKNFPDLVRLAKRYKVPFGRVYV